MSLSLNLLPPHNQKILSNFHLSHRLWLPHSPSLLSSPIPSHSWASLNQFSLLSPSSHISDRDLPFPSPVVRIKKFKFFPSDSLALHIKNSFRVTHYLYNYCIHLLNLNYKVTQQIFRDLLINTNHPNNIFPPNVKRDLESIPYDVKDEVIRDFIKAYKIQLDLVKQGKLKHFEMKVRSKAETYSKTITINHKHIKFKPCGIQFFPNSWSKEFIRFVEPLSPITHDCRIQVNKDGQFFLLVPIDKDQRKPMTVRKQKIGALDPGVKTFQTVYGSDNTAYTIGEDDSDEITKMGRIAQRMRDGIKKDQANGVKTYRRAKNRKERKALDRMANKLETKIKNKLSDLHRKTVKFLCDKYDTVIIPEFRTQKMVQKRNENGEWIRNIGKETAKRMMRWVRAKGSNLG